MTEVCLATSDPGTTNLVTGIFMNVLVDIPIIEDTKGVLAPLTKKCRRCKSKNRIETILEWKTKYIFHYVKEPRMYIISGGLGTMAWASSLPYV